MSLLAWLAPKPAKDWRRPPDLTVTVSLLDWPWIGAAPGTISTARRNRVSQLLRALMRASLSANELCPILASFFTPPLPETPDWAALSNVNRYDAILNCRIANTLAPVTSHGLCRIRRSDFSVRCNEVKSHPHPDPLLYLIMQILQ